MTSLTGEAGDIWRKRLEHANQNVVTGMLENLRYMMGKDDKQNKESYTTCVESKPSKSPAKSKINWKDNNVTVHVDTSGSMTLKHISESSYFINMKTAKHRYMRVEIMKSRN